MHGEDLNKEIEKAKMSKVKSLVDTIKDMFYTSEAKQDEEKDVMHLVKRYKSYIKRKR